LIGVYVYAQNKALFWNVLAFVIFNLIVVGRLQQHCLSTGGMCQVIIIMAIETITTGPQAIGEECTYCPVSDPKLYMLAA
jgi:hypothetical protein